MADAYSVAVLALSPVAYYQLAETSGTTCTDSSGNGYTMTYGASVTLNSTNLVAPSTGTAITIGAVSSAANSVISAAQVPALQPATTLTLMCWFKPTAVVSATGYSLVVYGEDNLTPWAAYMLDYATLTTGLGFYVSTGSGHSYNTTALVAGKTYFAVGVYNGVNTTAYLNGVAGTPVAGNVAIVYPTTGGLTIGTDSTYSDPAANAVIQHVAVLSAGLTAAQIISLYEIGISGAALTQPATSGAFSATGFAAALGAAPTSGDTLLIGISTYTAGAVTTPAGWALVASGTSGTENLYVYGKISAGTETSVTITATAPHGNWAYCEFGNGPTAIGSLVAGAATTASASTGGGVTSTVTPTTATGTVVSFHGARSTSTLTGVVPTSSQLTAQAVFATTASFGSIYVEYSQAALPASVYTESGAWNASCTSLVNIQVWIPSPIPPSWPTPHQNYQCAAILAQ
jgi:hypothetical protein